MTKNTTHTRATLEAAVMALQDHDALQAVVTARFQSAQEKIDQLQRELDREKDIAFTAACIECGVEVNRDVLVQMLAAEEAGLLAAAVNNLPEDKVGFKAVAVLDNGDEVPLAAGRRTVEVTEAGLREVVNACIEFNRLARLKPSFNLGQRDEFLADIAASNDPKAGERAANIAKALVIKSGANKLDREALGF